jgi:hypothetical protein
VALTPAEIRMNKLKKEAVQLLEHQMKDASWLDNYKKLVRYLPK